VRGEQPRIAILRLPEPESRVRGLGHAGANRRLSYAQAARLGEFFIYGY
jgi:hypothetical protein